MQRSSRNPLHSARRSAFSRGRRLMEDNVCVYHVSAAWPVSRRAVPNVSPLKC